MAQLDSFVEVVLNYPCGPSLELFEELDRLGVQLIEGGPVALGGRWILGKGSRGVVVKGIYRGQVVAVKIRRCDSPRKTMAHEVEMLKAANRVGVGPTLMAATESLIVMALVEGHPLGRHENIGDDELAFCVEDALAQARRLDEAGLDHGELSRAHSHVYWTGRGAVIIDFDSASLARKPHNYNSLASYLFRRRGELQRRVRLLLPQYAAEFYEDKKIGV